MSKHPDRHRLLFHIRHFGVGGIENALTGWLRGLNRENFSIHLSVALSTREFETVYRERLPADVVVHWLIEPDSWLTRMHQRRRDHTLGKLGRLGLGLGMALLGRRRMAAALRRITPDYDAVVDFDLTLRKVTSAVAAPMIGVRHFRLWSDRTPKAVRAGRSYKGYACVAVLNEAMRDQARALYGQELGCVATLPNAFDLQAMRRAARQRPAIPLPDTPYVVCVARLDIRTKGLDVLLRAWQRLLQARPEAGGHTLVIVGTGPGLERLQAMVQELGLQERVQFAGLQTNPYPWIRQARLLVLASRHEGLPNVLIEAMALGCMVVSTDCPVGPREILAGGRAGVLVPIEDEDALAEGIWTALSDEALRQGMLEAARERVEHYSIEAGNRRMLALVDQVVDR